MKKQFFRYLSGIIPAIVLFTHVNGQPAKARLQFNLTEAAYNEAIANPAITVAGNTSNINTRALKNFTKSFKNADKTDWSEIVDGFVARFEVNGIKTKAYYDRHGRWCSTLRTYDQYTLPKEIRKQVKSIYYDYDIYLVYEVVIEDKTVYLVKIQDPETLKTIRVMDGEMDVYEDYLKIDSKSGN